MCLCLLWGASFSFPIGPTKPISLWKVSAEADSGTDKVLSTSNSSSSLGISSLFDLFNSIKIELLISPYNSIELLISPKKSHPFFLGSRASLILPNKNNSKETF